MKAYKVGGVLSAALIVVIGSLAQAANESSDPVVGGSIMAVNVDVVATTGYRATQLLGSEIYNDKEENIGKLDDFIVGSDAKISIAVIAVGGVLGVGARMVAVPVSLFVRNDQGQTVLPSVSKDDLNALPEFRYAK